MGLIKFITNLFSSGRAGTLAEDDPEFKRLLAFDNTAAGPVTSAPPEEESAPSDVDED
jgi:hypothetical protein